MLRIDELKAKMNPEARHFVDFPEVVFFDEMSDHIEKLPGCEISEFEADGVFGIWIEFEFSGHKFFVDNAMGDFRFFVEDPKCDESILLEIADHLRSMLEGGLVREEENGHVN